MINHIYLRDFKSYKDARLPLAPLTVLIGANASGKSNALEGIRFLSWLAQGQQLSNLQNEVNQSDRIVRGRVNDLPRKGSSVFGLGIQMEGGLGRYTLDIFIRLQNKIELRIDKEELRGSEGKLIYRTKKRSGQSRGDRVMEFNRFSPKRPTLTLSFTDQIAVFGTKYRTISPAIGELKRLKSLLDDAAKVIDSGLAPILFLSPTPALMREYSNLSDRTLMGDGRNLSSVLYHLWHHPTEPVLFRKDILQFIASLPEQDIKKVGFIETPRAEVMLTLTETFGGNETSHDASLLSDGTLRVLAIVTALLSAPEHTLVVIEEIGNGVHPSRAGHLLSEIDRIARRRNLKVLISTHNPALLDALPNQAVPDVVFCYRDPEDGTSKLTKLSELNQYPELIAQGSLGSLLTKGLIEKYVKFGLSDEAEKEKALQWLASIKNLG